MTSTVRVNNPFHGYARCGWCGAPEHTECMGDDDKPAIEVCDGRRMLSAMPPPADLQQPVTFVDDVPHVPCMKCGVMIAVVGPRLNRPLLWCRAPACQAHKKQHARAQERKCAAPPPTARCICGKVFTPKRANHTACSNPCRERTRKDRAQKRNNG